jgi:hypothetical protein
MKNKNISKPATPPERDDDSGLRKFLARANRDARLMAQYLADWCQRDIEAGLVHKDSQR